ncbi:MAG: hypothetical protein BJ554DRAFT_1844, partial [Olpidium bornovanus]
FLLRRKPFSLFPPPPPAPQSFFLFFFFFTLRKALSSVPTTCCDFTEKARNIRKANKEAKAKKFRKPHIFIFFIFSGRRRTDVSARNKDVERKRSLRRVARRYYKNSFHGDCTKKATGTGWRVSKTRAGQRIQPCRGCA